MSNLSMYSDEKLHLFAEKYTKQLESEDEATVEKATLYIKVIKSELKTRKHLARLMKLSEEIEPSGLNRSGRLLEIGEETPRKKRKLKKKKKK